MNDSPGAVVPLCSAGVVTGARLVLASWANENLLRTRFDPYQRNVLTVDSESPRNNPLPEGDGDSTPRMERVWQ